jgi:hypothetical protein
MTRCISIREGHMIGPGSGTELRQDESWRPWKADPSPSTDSPYAHAAVEVTRRGWKDSQTVEPHKLDPWVNVYGLVWRPAARRSPSLGTRLAFQA